VPVTPTLTVHPERVAPGSTVAVAWEVPAGTGRATDWLGLFLVGSPNPSYFTYQYATGAATGQLGFVAPHQPGAYEVRYLPQNGYVDIARAFFLVQTDAPPAPAGPVELFLSPAVPRAREPVSVVWRVPAAQASPRDWIGLYRAGQPNTHFLAYEYTRGALQGSVTFPALGPDRYEIRYLLNDGYTAIHQEAFETGQ
jgi:hypothetical protein